MHLNSKTREIWAEKTLELTNIGAGALVFGQFLSGKEFSWNLSMVGIVLILFGYFASFVLLNKK